MQTPDIQITRKKRRFIRGRYILRWFAGLLCVLLMLFLVLEKNLESVILSMAQARVQAMAVDILNESVRQVLSGHQVYDELVAVRADQSGNITMIQADAVRMNELATATALLAQEKLSTAESETVDIPLGASLGIPFLAALGPNVQVRVVPVGAVTAEFTSEFESAGINQTRHKIYLAMHTTVRLVLPRGAERVEFTSQVLIAESIIVGQVPDSFIEVQDSNQALNFAP